MKVFYVLFILVAPIPAFAYLDPGTGSLLLYAIAGIATTVVFALRNAWYWLKGKVFLAGAPAVSARLPDLVLHSEGGKYWQVFKPVIDALSEQGAEFAYVSADPADPGLSCSSPGLRPIRPGGETATIAWMNAAKAALVVSTTPHLDVYMLKRSRGVGRYAHLFHSPTDIAYNEKYSFDWYDCLLTVGPFQDRSVRQLERRRGTEAKSLLPTGCSYYDFMLDEVREASAARDGEPTVLYAPAWDARSSLFKSGLGIIESLAASGYRVILRPHPQLYVSRKAFMAELEAKLSLMPSVEVDRRRTGILSMARSDAMICDLSGILFDYACLFRKPILLANAEIGAGGMEAEDLEGPLWDVESSLSLSWARIEGDGREAGSLARAAIASGADYAEMALRFRDESFYNFGAAGSAAARNIASLLGARQ